MSANEIKTGIKIEVQTNGTEQIKQLNQAIDDVPESLQKAREQAEKLKQVWQQDSTNQNAKMAYVRAAGEVKKLEQSLQSLNQVLDDTETQTAQAEQALDKFSKQSQKLQALNQDKQTLGLDVDAKMRQEIDEINQAFMRLKNSGTLSQKELARAAELHRDKLYRLEKQLNDLRPTIADVVNDFQSVATVGLGKALIDVSKEAIAFESAMAQVKKVTDATPAQIEQLSGSLKELGGELGIMPAELAKIAAAGGQMGMAFDKLPEFTRMTAQMSNAFGITAEAAGDMSAKISNVYSLTIEEMRELGDAMNTLGNTTAAKEAEIGNVLMRIGGNAKQFGLLKEEAAALSAAFVSLGKSPEEAGTAINALLTKLQTSTEQSAEFKTQLRELGLSAEEMAANIAANPQAALTDFLQRIEKLDKQSRSITLSKMFGAEYSDDLALLSGSLKTYEDALANATDRTKTFGAMQKEAGAALETTEGKMRQAKADISAAMIELGNTLLPVVQTLAGALGGVAGAVQSVSEQFPVLTKLAVLFASAKVATVALGTAMKLAGLDGQASFLKADVGVTKLKQSMLETATTAKLLGGNIKAAVSGNVDDINLKAKSVKELGGSFAQAAQNSGLLWSAWEAGKAVGNWLYEELGFVRDLGDAMGKGVAYLDAMFTDRTFEDVNREFRTTAELARELEKNQKEAAKAAKERQEADKKAAEQKQADLTALRNQYAENKKQFDDVSGSLKIMAERGQQGSQVYQALSEKQAKLAGELMQNQLQLEQFGDKSADGAAKTQAALSGLGLTAEQLSGKLSENAQRILTDFGTAAQSVGNDADKMAILFQAAAQKMDSPEALAALKQNMMEAAHKAGLTVEQMNKIAATAPQVGQGLAAVSKPLGEAEKAANALGVSLDNALVAGTGSAMSAALVHFDKIKSQLDSLQQNGINTGMVLRESLSKLTDTAQSESDIHALKQEITQLGAMGKLSMQDVERAILAADQKLNELRANTDPTAQAFERLGIKTKEAMRLSAEQMRQDFELVEQSGEAVSGSMKEKFAQVAAEMLASGNAQQQAWVQSKAAAYDYKVVIDETGKANLQAAAQTVQAAQTQVAAHNQVATAATQSAQAQSQVNSESQKTTQAIVSQGKALSELGQKVHYSLKQTGGYARLGTALWSDTIRHWQDFHINVHKTINGLNQETERGGDIAQWLSKATMMASGNVKVLDKITLNNLHQAIDKARQKMAQLAEEAKNARAEAEKELLSAQGRDDEVARLEQQRKINELRKKQQAAQKTGNREASADYEAAITASQRAFEERKRREAEQRERERMEAAQRETSAALPTPDVRVETNVNHLADLISAQNQQVAKQSAQQALQQFEQQLRDALSMQN